MRVLVVDDDLTVLDWAALVLRESGHAVDVARTAAEGRALASSHEYDLMLVDLDLPDGNGLGVVIAVRAARQDVPIIVITGRDDDEGVIACLDAGADDYLVKPVSNGVLRARVRAATRRGGAQRSEDLSLGNLRLDRLRRDARVGSHALSVTPREFSVLEHLLMHRGQVVSRSDLFAHVWGGSADTQTSAVDATVTRLRQKLVSMGATAAIHTTRGVGYVIIEERS